MTDDNLHNGLIIVSEGKYYVLCRRTRRGRLEPTGLLVSIPSEDEGPDAVVTIHPIDIAVLRMAIRCGAIIVVDAAKVPSTPPPPGSAAIAEMVMTGAVFSASRLMRRRIDFAALSDRK